MGYTTEFTGEFQVTPTLTAAQIAYLMAFNETRRMGRDETITAGRPDPVREAVGLPVGLQGGYFVGADGPQGQEGGGFGSNGDRATLGILDYNTPPKGQPGLWCQWVPNEEGTAIEWDGGEKFYDYVEWLQYIVEHFLKPWGVVLNGDVEWSGEERGDLGMIRVVNNNVTTLAGKVTY